MELHVLRLDFESPIVDELRTFCENEEEFNAIRNCETTHDIILYISNDARNRWPSFTSHANEPQSFYHDYQPHPLINTTLWVRDGFCYITCGNGRRCLTTKCINTLSNIKVTRFFKEISVFIDNISKKYGKRHTCTTYWNTGIYARVLETIVNIVQSTFFFIHTYIKFSLTSRICAWMQFL